MVFSHILIGKTPLTDKEIDDILSFRPGKTRILLLHIRSLMTYNEGIPILISHTLLYDYLIGCKEGEWYIDVDIEKDKIASRCFELTEG